MSTMNVNELIFEKVRTVEEYDLETKEIVGRYTQVEDGSLSFSADGTDVTDATGSPIATFYNNQQGTFSFSNSLISLDLMASQFGNDKKIGSTGEKIQVPVSETLTIGADNTVTLSYVPIGVSGAEINYIKVINDNNTFGATYTVTSSEATGKMFTISAAEKKITLPSGVTGKVFVNYVRETENAVYLTKTTDSIPKVRKLLIHSVFHDPCNVNIKYAGVIVCNRAQLDPSSIEVSLTMEGKHAATYKLTKAFCDENASLCDVIVALD